MRYEDVEIMHQDNALVKSDRFVGYNENGELIENGELAGKTISYQTGVITLILANSVNLLSKSGYAFTQGSRIFAKKFLFSVIIIIAFSFFGLIPFIK